MYKRVMLFCVLGLLLVSCSDKKAEVTSDNSDVMYVSTVKSELKMFEDELSSFGTITYKLKNDVTSLVSGTIYYLPIKEGTVVKKGQVIAKLRNVQLEVQKEQYLTNLTSAKASYDLERAKYSEALLGVESRLMAIDKSMLHIKQKELELDLLKKNLEKQEELHEIGGVTDSAIETQRLQLQSSETDIEIMKKELEISMLGLRKEDLLANGIKPSENPEEFKKQIIDLNTRTTRAELNAAEASVKAAEQQLHAINILIDELSIKSPVNGIVGAKSFELGEYVQENTTVATIIDISSVYAVVNIQENDIVNFSIGSPVAIEIPSINSKFNSEISEVSPIADAQSGNFAIKISLQNKKDIIKPGMFVKCRIQRAEPQEFVCVPETTLLSETNESAKLFCVNNDYVVQKEVKVKSKKDGNVWIEDGLKKNESVINNPSPLLKNGQKVQIINNE